VSVIWKSEIQSVPQDQRPQIRRSPWSSLGIECEGDVLYDVSRVGEIGYSFIYGSPLSMHTNLLFQSQMLYATETWLVAKVAISSAKTATTATNNKNHNNKSYFGKLK